MNLHASRTALLVALFVGTAGTAAAQTTPQPEDPHHPGGAPEAPAAAPDAAEGLARAALTPTLLPQDVLESLRDSDRARLEKKAKQMGIRLAGSAS